MSGSVRRMFSPGARPGSNLVGLVLAGLLLAGLPLASYAAGQKAAPRPARQVPLRQAAAHSVILFIGDGMGQAHRTAAQWQQVGQSGSLYMLSLIHI